MKLVYKKSQKTFSYKDCIDANEVNVPGVNITQNGVVGQVHKPGYDQIEYITRRIEEINYKLMNSKLGYMNLSSDQKTDLKNELKELRSEKKNLMPAKKLLDKINKLSNKIKITGSNSNYYGFDSDPINIFLDTIVCFVVAGELDMPDLSKCSISIDDDGSRGTLSTSSCSLLDEYGDTLFTATVPNRRYWYL